MLVFTHGVTPRLVIGQILWLPMMMRIVILLHMQIQKLSVHMKLGRAHMERMTWQVMFGSGLAVFFSRILMMQPTDENL